MYHNYLNKNLTIYKSKSITSALIIVTLNLGWLLFPLKNFNNKQLEPILFGFSRIYKFFFKMKGFGYKWKYLLHLKRMGRNIFF